MDYEDKLKIVKYSTLGVATTYLLYGIYKSIRILSYQTQETLADKNLKNNTIMYKKNKLVVLKKQITEPKQLNNIFFKGEIKREISRVDDICEINNIEKIKNEIKREDAVIMFFNNQKKLVAIISKNNCNYITFFEFLKRDGYMPVLNMFLFLVSLSVFKAEIIYL